MKTILKTITRFLKREQGFTLVEMVTVVAIMGVMAAVAVPMVSSQIGKARDKSYAQDVAMIQTAVDSFFTDSDNARFQGQRQYPIMGANSGTDAISPINNATREFEVPQGWVDGNSSTNLNTPLNPKRGTQGGEPKWMDGGLDGPDSTRKSDEDKLNGEKESINRTGVGWYITKVTHQGADFAVDTRDYFIDFRKLVELGLLQSVPQSASLDNGGGSATGSYSWYVKSTGEVDSLFVHFPTNGTDIFGNQPELENPDDPVNPDGTINDGVVDAHRATSGHNHPTSSDQRGFIEGVYP